MTFRPITKDEALAIHSAGGGQPHLLPKNARVRVLGLARGNEGLAIAKVS